MGDVMAVATLTPGQFDLVYNMLSLGLASMAASTVFFFLRLGSVKEQYKAALCFTGLVTFIAMYHYFRIFDSFNAAYSPCHTVTGTNGGQKVDLTECDSDHFGYSATGIPFNDAYRYVDWLLTVPLLLIEIVLVMRLSEAETFDRCCKLGVFSALMIANGYPGEISADPSTRWIFWLLSMCPFVYIVYTLFVGLKASQDSQPEAVRDQVRWACWATVFSWCTYPIVFVMPMMMGSEGGKAGLSASSMVAIQVGYTFSDIISKCGVGYLVYRIGLAKSMNEDLDNVLDGMMEDSSEYQVVTVLEATKPKPSTKVEKAQPKPKPEVPKPKPKAAEKPQMKPLPKKVSPAKEAEDEPEHHKHKKHHSGHSKPHGKHHGADRGTPRHTAAENSAKSLDAFENKFEQYCREQGYDSNEDEEFPSKDAPAEPTPVGTPAATPTTAPMPTPRDELSPNSQDKFEQFCAEQEAKEKEALKAQRAKKAKEEKPLPDFDAKPKKKNKKKAGK